MENWQLLRLVLGICILVSGLILLGITASNTNKDRWDECSMLSTNHKGLSWAGLITGLIAGGLLAASAFVSHVFITHSYNLLGGVSLFLLGMAAGFVATLHEVLGSARDVPHCLDALMAFQIITSAFLIIGLVITYFAK